LQQQEKDVKHNEKYYKTDPELQKIDKLNNEIVLNLLNKRLSKIKEYDKNIHQTTKNFSKLIKTYHKTVDIFTEIITEFPNLADLYLEEKSELLKKLNNLSIYYDSTQFFYDKYITALNNYPILNYNQKLIPLPIKTYRLQGIARPNFLADTIFIWNYKKWAENLRNKLNTDISHFRQTISKTNKELANKERDLIKLTEFSNSYTGYYLDQKVIFEIEKFDYNSLITPLFLFRNEKINLIVKNKRIFNDTSTVFPLPQTRSKELFDLINIMTSADSLLKLTKSKATEDNYLKHKDFIDFNYKGLSGLQNYLATQKNNIYDIINNAITNNLYFTYRDIYGLDAKIKTIEYKNKIIKSYVEKIEPQNATTNEYYTLSAALTKDGSKYITGYYKTNIGTTGFVAKITNNQIEWFKNTSNTPRVTEFGAIISATTNGCYVIIHTIINDKHINTLLQFDAQGKQISNIKLQNQNIPRQLNIDEINQTAIITFQGKKVNIFEEKEKQTTIEKINIENKKSIWKQKITLEGNIINIVKFDTTYHIFANYKNATINETNFLNKGFNILHIEINEDGKILSTNEIKSDFFYFGIYVYKINSNVIELIGLSKFSDFNKSKFSELPKPYIIFLTKDNKTIYQNFSKDK
jgi:hypothetical protein